MFILAHPVILILAKPDYASFLDPRVLERPSNPHARVVEEAISAALTREEADRFAAHLRPLVRRSRPEAVCLRVPPSRQVVPDHQ